MAINDFKNIEKLNQELEQTAQLINPTDLNIFKTSAKNVTDFGLSKNDAIEFRLYDMSNNLLEQSKGVKVRYIHKDELPNYLRDSIDSTNGEKILEINVEKLVFEAGYANGEFRVSFSFLKNYVGNENTHNRVWIHEVSPSRTEIRVLPLLGSDSSINAKLQDRYDSFIDNVSEFRYSYKKIETFLDKAEISISTTIDDYFIKSFGEDYIKVINKDFVFGGNEGYVAFKNKTYKNFRESVMHEINGREFKLGVPNYGQPVRAPYDLDEFISNAEFTTVLVNRLRDSIEFSVKNLPKKEWPLPIKQTSGQYKPSAILQSLLTTGYNTVTYTQTMPDMGGVVGNTSNRTVVVPANEASIGTTTNTNDAGRAVTWASTAPTGPIESNKYVPITEKIAKADEGTVSMGTTQTYVEKTNPKDNEQQPVIPKDNFDNGGSNSTHTGTRGGAGGGNAGVVSGGGGRIDDAINVVLEEQRKGGAAAKSGNKKGGGGANEGEMIWV